jgi:crotonobetainyl-CoA:carnitine CoA-transferase CaiB-like acyl-CoA transferase
MTTPLRGFRVLDLTNVLAGPFCCHQLAHMGAEVIKVEVPGSGDLARQLGADPQLNRRHMGVSFLAQNAGKKSMTLDLKKPAGKALLKRLVRTADVLVENFRPGVMDRLEVGYEVLKGENPQLVYCAISGYGQDGPMRGLPAYDQIIQGMSGLMSITGEANTGPYRVGYPVADTIGGMTAAFAVAAALASRARDPHAAGCFIDVSMLESVIATMGWVVSNYLIAGKEPAPLGNENFTAAPSGTFRTGQGLLNIAANKQEQFEGVCTVLGLDALRSDPRFAERQARLEHRFELKALLEETLAADSAERWSERLNAAGVPAGRVLGVPEILDHPQVRDRGMVGRFEDVPGVGRDIRVVRTGVKLDGEPPRVDTPPPQLGEHTEVLLAGLGYSADQIAQLRQDAVI